MSISFRLPAVKIIFKKIGNCVKFSKAVFILYSAAMYAIMNINKHFPMNFI